MAFERITEKYFHITFRRVSGACIKWAERTRSRSIASKALLASLILMVCCGAASAQGNAPQEKMTKILREVMRTEVPLTRELHKEFWSDLRKLSPNEQSDFSRMASTTIIDAHAYQVEVWESALLSFRKRKVFKSGKMLSLEVEIRSKMLQTPPTTLSENAKNAAIREIDAKYKNSFMNSNRLLEAAANNQSLQIAGRGTFEVNETILQTTIARLKGIYDRLQQLLNPVWTERVVNDAQELR